MGKKKRTNNKQNSSSTTMKNIDEKVLAREIIQAYEEFEQKKKQNGQQKDLEWESKRVEPDSWTERISRK